MSCVLFTLSSYVCIIFFRCRILWRIKKGKLECNTPWRKEGKQNQQQQKKSCIKEQSFHSEAAWTVNARAEYVSIGDNTVFRFAGTRECFHFIYGDERFGFLYFHTVFSIVGTRDDELRASFKWWHTLVVVSFIWPRGAPFMVVVQLLLPRRNSKF